MIQLESLEISNLLLVFLAAAVTIALVGTRITHVADRLADATGWGEALFGAVFLGASTSLPGIVTSVTAAIDGHADLAFSNALGGIAAQTVFLAIADMFYRRANLEHAAASVPNMMQGALLLIMLTAVLMFMTSPAVEFWRVHPGSVVLLLVYIFAIRMIAGARKRSTWHAAATPETVIDAPESARPSTRRERIRLWSLFAVYAAVLAVAGFVVARTAETFCAQTGATESIVGGLFTAVTTSLPELVTSVAAVRKGALTLAVSDIIGGNCFDVLFITAADVAFREGSIYHAVQDRQRFIVALAALLTAILLLGLLRREKRGFANIGFESIFVLLLYIGGVVVLVTW